MVGARGGVTGTAPIAPSTTTPSMTHVNNPHTSSSTFMKHQNHSTKASSKTQLSSSPTFLLAGNNFRGENPPLLSGGDANNNNLSNNYYNNYSQYLTGTIDQHEQSGIPTQQLLSYQGLGEKRVAAPSFGFTNFAANTMAPATSVIQPCNAASFAAMRASSSKVVKPTRTPTAKQHTSKMTYEEVASLAKACTTEDQILFVARQATGPGTTNGFVKCTSTMMKLKKQKVRDYNTKQNKQAATNAAATTTTASLAGNIAGERATSTIEDEDIEEKMKKYTFLPPLAKRMRLEMTQGLQYCNMMSDIIRTIIEDIDPENPILGIPPPPVVVVNESTTTTTTGGKPNRKARR